MKQTLNQKKRLYRLKDITLPSFIFNDPRYEIPIQAHNEPRNHWLWKCHLGYHLRQYIDYNTNHMINDNIMDHPFFRHLTTSMIMFEHPHVGVKVTKKNELTRQYNFRMSVLDQQYLYHSDIAWIIDWKGHKYHIFIEINGGIHTKNPEQKQNNRMRYEQIRNYYDSKKDIKMIMIIFESDEYIYHPTQYFIDIIINTVLEDKKQYPELFLFFM